MPKQLDQIVVSLLEMRGLHVRDVDNREGPLLELMQWRDSMDLCHFLARVQCR